MPFLLRNRSRIRIHIFRIYRRGNLFGDARCEHELQITTTRQYLVYWPSDSWWHSKHGPTSNHSKGKGIPQQFRRSNSTGCTTWLVRLLPHAKFPDLKTTLSVTYECWGILSRSLMIKNVPKHRAYPTYNISKARPKRISSPKVVLILLLKFIFPSHGNKLFMQLSINYHNSYYNYRLRN